MLSHFKSYTYILVIVLLVLVGLSKAAENSSQIIPPPTRIYVLASPRACLINPTNFDWVKQVIPPPLSIGAAENFPRDNGEIKIASGTRVVFCLSRQLEGVWYPGSFGKLGCSLVLQMRKPIYPLPEEPYPQDMNDINEDALCPWVTIGHDAASDVRFGPSIGRAKIGVPVLFKKPGLYLLRGVIQTTAQPYPKNQFEPADNANLPEQPPTPKIPPVALDKDIVYVKVKVVDLPIIQIVPDEPPSLDPDATYIIPMPKEFDPDQISADLNGDRRVDFADLAIMAQQWGKQVEIPFADE